MIAEHCAAVRQWLSHYSETPPPAHLVSHVQDCSVCQAALLTLVTARIGIPAPHDATCATAEVDLPAMLDRERSAGAVVAARAYPDLWWHLWTCPSCAEVYHDTAILLAATDAGLLTTSLPQADQPTIRLARTFLRSVFGPQLAAGAAWDSTVPALQLLAEEALPDGQIGLYVGAEDANHWRLEVHMRPPRYGTLLVGLGEQVYTLPLHNHATALFTQLPAAFLNDVDGPDLAIRIVRDGSG